MLEINNLNINEHLQGVSFEVRLNSFKIIYGDSPLFNAIYGIEKFDKGTIILENKKVSYLHREHIQNLRKSIYYIPKENFFIRKRTLFDNFLQISGKNRDKIISLTTRMGLANSINKRIFQLNSDEVFRAKLLLAILQKPEILLANIYGVEEETIYLIQRFAEDERFGVLLESCSEFDKTLFTESYKLEKQKIVLI
ncbi:putative ATPase involved in cell division [Thiovulum sp. ES]|nr:putative ATPase involved in cell division [Thiovulum sp. ES]